MPTTYRPYQPDQPLLLPPDLQEWVPPGHLAHHVSDVVDALDLTAFYSPYEGDGRRNAPYEPSMMVKVLIYAYATGTFSSRAVARKLEEDVAFRMLAAGNFPQHRTVCEFRRRHLAEFSELFVGVVQVAREMGLARFGKLSIDGTKVRANASKRKAMSYERMGREEARLQAEIAALLTKAGAVDAEEDERWGEDFRGDELPEELQRREKRLAAIQAAKARLEAAQRARDDEHGREPGQDRHPRGGRPYKRAYGEPEAKAQSNFTDPESQIMKTSSEGFQQCYNAQMAVDGEHQIIVATEVGPQVNDQGQLVGLLDGVNETFGGRACGGTGRCGVLQTSRICWSWKTAASTRMSRWGVKASPGWRSTRRGSLPRTAWVRSWRASRARPSTRNASGSRRRRTGGSRRCSDSDDTACEAWRRCAASGTSCAWR